MNDGELREAERAYASEPSRANEVRLALVRARIEGRPGCSLCSATGFFERDVEFGHQRLPCAICTPEAFAKFKCPVLEAHLVEEARKWELSRPSPLERIERERRLRFAQP